MIPLDLPAIAAVVGGTVHDDAGGVVVDGPAFLDSRTPVPGGLFAAFTGEHVDGHDFAVAAVAGGAAAVLASRPVGVPAVVVPDVAAALARLARAVLERLPGLRVVAVTGSQGKTSTKDLLAAVLGDAAPTVATAGSYNNELGLPLTVLGAEQPTRFLVLEMGARGVGHIAQLCQIAPPDVALVLNVGKAHLGEFGSQEAIARAKGELVEALGADGTAVLNADDPVVAGMAGRTRGRVVRFGVGPDADVRLSDLRLDDRGRPHFVLHAGGQRAETALQLVGEHHASNALAAVAAATELGVPLAAAAASLGSVQALSRWRMEVTDRADGVTVVNDAYNANPDSVAAALRALVAIGARRRTVAVLGEMLELGPASVDEHEEVGRLVAELGVRRLLVVGEAARPVLEGAVRAGFEGDDVALVPHNAAASDWLAAEVEPGDVVLLKASRGVRLDEVAAALLQAQATVS